MRLYLSAYAFSLSVVLDIIVIKNIKKNLSYYNIYQKTAVKKLIFKLRVKVIIYIIISYFLCRKILMIKANCFIPNLSLSNQEINRV